MFQIKKIEYVNKTFRLPLELTQKMENIAQEKHVSLNNLVVQCCEYALNSMDNDRASEEISQKP